MQREQHYGGESALQEGSKLGGSGRRRILKVGAVVAAAALGATAVATVVLEGGGSGEGASRPSLAQLSVIAGGAAATEAATRGHATQLMDASASASAPSVRGDASPSDAIANAIKTAGTALTADQRAMFEGEAAQAVHMEKMHEKWDKARLGRILGRITRKIDDEAKEMKQHQETEAEIQAHRERVALKRTGDHSAERGIAAGGHGKEEEEEEEVRRKGVGMEQLAVAGGSDEKFHEREGRFISKRAQHQAERKEKERESEEARQKLRAAREREVAVKDELRDALSERDEAAEAIRRDDMLSSRAATAQLAPFESKVQGLVKRAKEAKGEWDAASTALRAVEGYSASTQELSFPPTDYHHKHNEAKAAAKRRVGDKASNAASGV